MQFNDIPANLRVPGVYIEFDSSLAGNSVVAFKLLVIGQRLATGTVAEGVPTLVSNPDDAETYFGRGSMLAEQIKALKHANQFIETWAIALDDDGAAVDATGTITATGAATANGTIPLMIAGKKVNVAVFSGDTQDDMATAIAAAITADTTLPVTAAVNGVTTNQVDLTCKWAGETGNDIDLRVGYYGEKLPAGTAIAFGAMAGGTTNPDLATAINAFGDEWWNWIVMPYTDTANLVALETELESRWGPMVQKGARAFTAYKNTLALTSTFGNGRNSPHVSTMGINTSPTPPWNWAAINAVVAAASLSIDPARPLQTLTLPGVLAPAIEDRWTTTERNTLLYDGIATHVVNADGTVSIERQITMYQLNAAGNADDAYLDINTPETLERIRFTQRSLFARKFPRHKLANDSAKGGEGVMQPKIARAELLMLYRDMEDLGWVQGYDDYKASVQVEVDANDPTRLNVQDSPMLVGQYRVHAQKAQFLR
ncbi:MAG TPA: phage tail sheath subtilisin-like domain-containing protein [Gammaproteobacteria bacterium]